MTDAMQMMVSSEIENRMEDSNSTLARQAREPDFSSSPWVDTVIATHGVHKKSRPAFVGLPHWKRMRVARPPTVCERLVLTQTGNIVGHRFDFTVIELGSHLVHLQAIFTNPIAESR